MKLLSCLYFQVRWRRHAKAEALGPPEGREKEDEEVWQSRSAARGLLVFVKTMINLLFRACAQGYC